MTNKRVHAFAEDVLGDYDATDIAGLIRERRISAEEAAKAAIARAEKVKHVIKPIAFEAYESALADSGRPRRGFFAGVPTFIKDNAEVRGMPMRQGSAAIPPKPLTKDGYFVEQYLKMGFTVLGKSRMPEFGFTATTEFAADEPCRNPWHTDYSSGGSSGGSAALVADGVVPMAHGNDGGGSIRIPAACCGLVGLKSTRDRFINSSMARSIPVRIVSDGVLTRSVRDTANFFYAMERVWQNKKLPPVGFIDSPGKERLRIGVVIDSITGTPTCPETRTVVEKTAALLESMGHHVEPMHIQVPESFIEDFTLYWSMLAFLLTSFGNILFPAGFYAERTEPFTRGLLSYYKKRFVRTPQMLYRLQRSATDYAEGMRGYDAVLSPVLAHTVPELGYLHPETDFETLFRRLINYVSFTPLNNASGSPAISLPLGTDSQGVPIGIQLQSAYGTEAILLKLAYELEEARLFQKITD